MFAPILQNVVNPILQASAGGLASYFSTKLSHKAASAAEDKAWNRTTEYNHPKAQKERFIEAGLSPNLMYSNAGASAGNTTSDIQQRQPFTLQDTVHKYLTLEAMLANNDLVKANIANVMADTDYKHKEASLLGKYGLKTDPNWIKVALRGYNFGRSLFDVKSQAFKDKLYNDNLKRLK